MQHSRAKKRLGQNFLVDESFVAPIVQELALHAGETVVEIGAGRGALTSRLVATSAQVIAIEFDRDLVPVLQDRFSQTANLTLVQQDVLEVDFCSIILPRTTCSVVGNLPYNISTAILRRLIAHRGCIDQMILMLQREVVDRITAEAGSSDRGFLSVLVEAYCTSEKLYDVPPQAFRPVPKVWSTVVRLQPGSSVTLDVDEFLLWKVVSTGFSQRRKTILNNLRAAPDDIRGRIEAAGGAASVLDSARVDPKRRPETLRLGEWLSIVKAM